MDINEKNANVEALAKLFDQLKSNTPEKVMFYAALGAAYKEHLSEDDAKETTAIIYKIFNRYSLDVIFDAVRGLKINLEKDPPENFSKTRYRKMVRAEIGFLSAYLRQFNISTRMTKEELGIA